MKWKMNLKGFMAVYAIRYWVEMKADRQPMIIKHAKMMQNL